MNDDGLVACNLYRYHNLRPARRVLSMRCPAIGTAPVLDKMGSTPPPLGWPPGRIDDYDTARRGRSEPVNGCVNHLTDIQGILRNRWQFIQKFLDDGASHAVEPVGFLSRMIFRSARSSSGILFDCERRHETAAPTSKSRSLQVSWATASNKTDFSSCAGPNSNKPLMFFAFVACLHQSAPPLRRWSTARPRAQMLAL